MAREGIIEQENGILQQDGIWFHDPSEFAQNHLFYPKWGAEYVCTAPYEVQRTYLDAFILFYIMEGELFFHYHDSTFCAQAGQAVLLDCHSSNHYWATKRVRFQWLHFSGNASSAYATALFEHCGACFERHQSRTAAEQLSHILQALRAGNAEDHMLSCCLHSILASLSAPEQAPRDPIVAHALMHIRKHFAEPLSVEDLARLTNVSAVHFTRLFRRETGRSPHEYLLLVRMNHARRLLTDTTDSIEVISELCGFASSPHFIRMFKKRNGFTPLQFRKLF